MRIWIFNHYAAPPDQPVGTRHFDLGRRLVARGHEVTLVAAAFNHWTHTDEILRPGQARVSQVVDGVEFVWVRSSHYGANDVRRVAGMVTYSLNAIRAGLSADPPTVVVGSSVHPLAALAGLIVARRYGVPFVFEVRDLWPEALIAVGEIDRTDSVARALFGLEAFLCRDAARIITLLPDSIRYLAGVSGRVNNIDWIPNGVDALAYSDVGQRPPDQPFTFMYAGAHGRANGLRTILEAFGIAQSAADSEGSDGDMRLVLVGDGAEKQGLVDFATRRKLRGVAFLDPVPKRDLPGVLCTADAFVFHLVKADVFRHGLSSNKLFSYMAAGRPIVFACETASNMVAMAGAGLTVAPEDPTAIAGVLLRLLRTDEQVRLGMGRRGRAFVCRHFDLDRLAESFERSLELAVRSYA